MEKWLDEDSEARIGLLTAGCRLTTEVSHALRLEGSANFPEVCLPDWQAVATPRKSFLFPNSLQHKGPRLLIRSVRALCSLISVGRLRTW